MALLPSREIHRARTRRVPPEWTGEPFYSDGPGASQAVRESIELCTAVVARPEAEQDGMIEVGLRLAERAVAPDPDDARAHFALFCHLGRQAQRAGVSAGILPVVTRMRDALDHALVLQPTYVDALVGEGALLLELPWFLGGDEERGEELLRRALALDGGFEPARERLAAFLAKEGRVDEMPLRAALQRSGGGR